MPKAYRFWIVVFLQILFLIVMPYSYYQAVLNGEKVLLQTIPIDPRDLIFGDYVTIGFKIQTLDYELLKDSNYKPKDNYDEKLNNKDVFVTLAKGKDDIHEADGIYLKQENVPNQKIFIKGKISGIIGGKTEQYDEKTGKYLPVVEPYRMNINYGQFRYYVEQDTGLAIENALRDSGKIVKGKVSISSSGKMVLMDLDYK
jgi:uncharacterized membrane-anchored protein